MQDLRVGISPPPTPPPLRRPSTQIQQRYTRVIPEAESLTESIRCTFVRGAESTTTLYHFVRARSEIPINLSQVGDRLSESEEDIEEGGASAGLRMNIGERSIDWRLALPELARALSIHLIGCE